MSKYPDNPLCVLAMGCYCAAHAMGAPVEVPCNADEASARARWGRVIEHEDEAEQDHAAEPCDDCGVCTLCGCDCDPTPYETPNDPDPADTLRDSLEEARRYKR